MSQNNNKRALQVLRTVHRAMENATGERQLLDDVCRIATQVGGYRFAWAGYIVQDAAQSVRFMAYAGHHPDYLEQITIGWGDNRAGYGPAGNAIRTLKPSIVQHITDNPDFLPWRKAALSFGYRSVIALPLKWQDKAFGCLTILSGEPDAFDTGEADLLTELASSLSYGINALHTRAAHEQAVWELRTERDTQETLQRILSLSLQEVSLEEKLNQTLELLFDTPWLRVERKGSIFLFDEGSNSLHLAAKRHLSPVLHELCAEVPLGHCLCGKAAANRELVFHSHVDEAHHINFDGMPDHGHYCQPICSSTGVLGVLNLYVSPGHQSNPTEVRFLGAVADTLAGLIEREQAESTQQRLVTLLEATPDLVAITDPEGRCLYCNDSAQEHMGVDASCSGCGKNIFNHYPDEVAKEIRTAAYPMAMEAGLWEGQLALDTQNGGRLPVSLLIMSHRDSQGNIAYLSTMARDISDRIKAEQSAKAIAIREKNFANTLINSLPGIFYLTDEKARLIRWNSNFETLLGYQNTQLENIELKELLTKVASETLADTTDKILQQGSASMEMDFVDHKCQAIPFYITGTLMNHHDTGRTIVNIGIDLSYRKQLEQELRKLATTDALTGAYNRLKMEEVLEQELRRSDRHRSAVSIAMLDIDHFKKVNDTYGHDTGDKVLKAVAAIAKAQLRNIDFLARWGGEEFMIISADTTLAQMQSLAERVRSAIEQYHGNEGIRVTASLGIGQYRQNENQKQFLKRVDDALYKAKDAGRNQVRSSS